MGKKKKKASDSSPVQPSAPPPESPSSSPYVVPYYYIPTNIDPAYSNPAAQVQQHNTTQYPQESPPKYTPTPEDAEAQKKTEKRRKKKIKQKTRNTCIPKEVKAFAAFITIGLAVFDIYADANMLRIFFHKEMSYLTYAMICIVFASCVLFFLQIYAFYLRIKSLCDLGGKNLDHEERDAQRIRRENRYLCCAETTSYLLLLLEDTPSSAILVLVTAMPMFDFHNGVDYCALYYALFEDTFAGWLALLASLCVAGWKFFLSFFYCCRCCCMEWDGIEGHCFRGCCCFFRIIRPILAFVMVGGAFYIYYFHRAGLLVTQLRCDFDDVAQSNSTKSLAELMGISSS